MYNTINMYVDNAESGAYENEDIERLQSVMHDRLQVLTPVLDLLPIISRERRDNIITYGNLTLWPNLSERLPDLYTATMSIASEAGAAVNLQVFKNLHDSTAQWNMDKVGTIGANQLESCVLAQRYLSPILEQLQAISVEEQAAKLVSISRLPITTARKIGSSIFRSF